MSFQKKMRLVCRRIVAASVDRDYYAAGRRRRGCAAYKVKNRGAKIADIAIDVR
jgi:hypothetical protein